ncbi:MAG TPA: hypothetical protein VEJ17_00745 [Candidatus Nitrosotalea sp.]|nr:hypothetical protein [Candidatus Nitrosotalea sp.]
MIDYSGEISDNLKYMRVKSWWFKLRMEECKETGDHERAEEYRQRLEAVSAAIEKLKGKGKDKPDEPDKLDTYGYP